MSDKKNVDNPLPRGHSEVPDTNIAVSSSEVSSVAESVKTAKTQPRVSSSSERQIKFERAQKCLENAALVSKRIKEHRKATAELLGRPFEDDDGGDTASEMASTMSERTSYSAATDTSTTLSVQDALNIPGISESLANTLKQKELLMERIKQYKEISKRPMKTAPQPRKDSVSEKIDIRKSADNADVTQLVNTIKDKENVLSVMQVRLKAMETTILDLQEKINEKDQIIEAKNMATTLMSDSLSKKEKDSLILLEDTKQQMIKMQENFVNMEAEWKDEKGRLVKQIEEKDDKIKSLEEANSILENSRFEISVSHSKAMEELELKNKEILYLQEQINELSKSEELSQKEKEDVEEEKGSIEISNMVELTKKVELLEQLNCQIRQTNKELESKIATMNVEPKVPTPSSPSKKGSPLPSRKGGRNTASKAKSPWSHLSSESLPQETDKKVNKTEINKLEVLVQSLNKDILDKEYSIAQKDSLLSDLRAKIEQYESTINELKSQVKSDVAKVDVGLCTEIQGSTVQLEPVPLKHVETAETIPIDFSSLDREELEHKLQAAQMQITSLNEEIEAANKNMIKVKSNQKLKLKQMQKTIDNFSKVSDANAEIVKLNEELHQLTQKVAELEEEKGNLQLHLVDYDSGRLTESDVYKKMVEMENLAETRLKSISVLEAQKFDLVQELHELQQKNVEMDDKLADMVHYHSEQVSSEIKSVQLEEQIDQLAATKKELELVIENLKLDKEQLEKVIKEHESEKEELMHKLENYIQENIELTDKLDKLSAEKVSSAESIEIVESLTTQEKLELEEYNKGIIEHKVEDSHATASHESDENIEKLMEQSVELNRKIELFTQERQEVMEKMSIISDKNKSLQEEISGLNIQIETLQDNITALTSEKMELNSLNEELSRQVDELKRERLEIMKESVEIVKPVSVDETMESGTVESHTDDKNVTDKGNRVKSVKQLTKEILKLKNTIKEREDEIADCQMKILSLEEQQQKQKELMQNVSSYETKIKTLTEENNQLKQELENIKDTASEEQTQHLIQSQESLKQEIQKLHQDYTLAINARDARIHELENHLLEYEKQVFNYNNTLQQKDKEMVEYINQITKLNDVSQKLKSTIELLEEEKAKDPNGELVKNLNYQISVYQKKLTECEDKLKNIEEERAQLINKKHALESKNVSLDNELKVLQESFAEKQGLIKELQAQNQKYDEDMSDLKRQFIERDEEIHEVKLQLRKESIENEKLRNASCEKESVIDNLTKELDETKQKVEKLTQENIRLTEECTSIETKNKEQIEKLKKFAVNLKKRANMYNELETQHHETQKQLELKSAHLEQVLIQVETLPALQEKLKLAEDELNRLQMQRTSIEQQKSQDIKSLEDRLIQSENDNTQLSNTTITLQNELQLIKEENSSLKTQIDALTNKIVEYEIEQKNNSNLITKISSLESDINQKQSQISELLTKVANSEQQFNQLQNGHDAKVQERDLYIESLEAEITKYKNRICRLEEGISVMEDRRHSLERKADQLDSQLQEKQKAYSEYTNQEDELIKRLAVLMDHDRVVEKQLHEIENDNKELQYKIQHFTEENQRLRKSLSDIQEHCNTLVEKASKADWAETEIVKYQAQNRELETQLKRLTHEHQTIISQKKRDIEELEAEFNTQIENSIKEKKTLSEKYEKMNEHVTRLELRLQEHINNNQNLNINIEELTRINQELMESSNKQPVQSPDYTDQYINEINHLNSVINTKNQEISALQSKIQTLQTNAIAAASNQEIQMNQLTNQLDQLNNEIDLIKSNNAQLQNSLSQKDDQIKQLIEKKTVTFEMNIPKTEGMIISSTIEPFESQKMFDKTSLESQIVPSNISGSEIFDDIASLESQIETVSDSKLIKKKGTEKIQKQSTEDVVEPVIVPKKAYLCYKGEDAATEETDPFNSDEGWGLDEGEELEEVTPGMSNLLAQIEQLNKENTALKADLETSNNKLLKLMKKFKDLKTRNEMLSNELKISKQMSESSFLDSAIEDELKIKIQDLEKKIEELSTDLNKEKREKESLRKQNEVFNNANERLTEMKEKQDSEIELWKYKFKEVNDKMSTLQWSAEAKDSPVHKSPALMPTDDSLKDEIAKLEKENEELQSITDQLTNKNHELTIQNSKMNVDINALNQLLEERQKTRNNIEVLNNRLEEVQSINIELQSAKDSLDKQVLEYEIRCKEVTEYSEQLKIESEKLHKTLEDNNKKLVAKNLELENEIQTLKSLDTEARIKISSLVTELEDVKSKILWHEQQANSFTQNVDSFALSEKYSAVEDQYTQIVPKYEDAKNKIVQLEAKNNELNLNLTQQNNQIEELNEKLSKLNTENDQLLSTVAELRSSVSSAVDQRGFEIAELWKQHLAQRESDFQKTEQELRGQLSEFEVKYEQLLDSVQSSSQEETNKLVIMEQITSLQNKLHDKEEHLRNLQDKYAEVLTQLDMLRSELDDEKLMHENKLLAQQDEYEKQLVDVRTTDNQSMESTKQKLLEFQSELALSKEANNALSQENQDLKGIIEDCEEKILELTNELRIKDSEIYQKTHDYSITLAQKNEEFETVRRHLLEYEKRIEDLTYEKESELAVLRLKMHENSSHYDNRLKELETENTSLSEALNIKIVECTNLNKEISELNKLIEEHSNRISEMQTALENQEMEIVTLKDQIDILEEDSKLSIGKIEKHVTFSSDTKPGLETEKSEDMLNKELLDAVPRAELDLALYMLHQRDVRCEELTMELTQLLEERDTLQLRLSDSIRSYEDLKAKCKLAGLDVSASFGFEPAAEPPSSSADKEQQFVDTHRGQTSRSSSVSEPDGDKPKLQAKLSELRTVRHSRDVRLRQDSEQRQSELRLLQRDVANLPPEAVHQLAQAHHTLSRDSQSTSTVLLNWLRGKSTPKVVHM